MVLWHRQGLQQKKRWMEEAKRWMEEGRAASRCFRVPVRRVMAQDMPRLCQGHDMHQRRHARERVALFTLNYRLRYCLLHNCKGVNWPDHRFPSRSSARTRATASVDTRPHVPACIVLQPDLERRAEWPHRSSTGTRSVQYATEASYLARSSGTPLPPSSRPSAFRSIVIGCIGVS